MSRKGAFFYPTWKVWKVNSQLCQLDGSGPGSVSENLYSARYTRR